MSAGGSLPESWSEVALGDVVDYGKTVKAEPSEIPGDAWLLELEDIEKDSSKVLTRTTFAERRSKSTKNRFAAGDVLYGKLRPYLNKVIQADRDGFCTTEIVPLKPNAALNGAYLFYWLRHPRFLDYVTSVSHGLNMPRLGTDAGRRAPLILAPINEQKRIAERLDLLIPQVESCRARMDRVPQILKRFREAVLEAAVSGRLTEEWRDRNPLLVDAKRDVEAIQQSHADAGGHRRGNAAPPTNDVHDLESSAFPTGWGLVDLRELVDPARPITYGILKPGPEIADGVRYVRVADFPNDRLNLASVRRTSPKIDKQFARSRLRPGDLLLSIRGTVGRLIVVPEELDAANITQDSARLAIQTRVESRYVLWFLRRPPGFSSGKH
jgi:type I restriction enzyme S subunit